MLGKYRAHAVDIVDVVVVQVTIVVHVTLVRIVVVEIVRGRQPNGSKKAQIVDDIILGQTISLTLYYFLLPERVFRQLFQE